MSSPTREAAMGQKECEHHYEYASNVTIPKDVFEAIYLQRAANQETRQVLRNTFGNAFPM
jgi:hypothetical protein